MRKSFIIILIPLGVLIFGHCSSEDQSSYNDLSPAEQMLERGRRVYKKYCISCHGADGKMGLSGAKDLSESELDLAQRKMIIASGKNTMTPFKNILSEEEIEAVAQYTFTLSGKNE